MQTNHQLAGFDDLVDLANEKIGGAAIACSDDFFAGMDALVKSKDALWDEHAYTDRGKWMDGWESKRSHKNGPDEHYDWCVVRLGAPGIVHGVIVDTAFFRGNFPAYCAIEGTSIEGYPTPDELIATATWVPLLAKSALDGNARNSFNVSSRARVTHVRLRIFPDGGVARLRVFGEVLADLRLVGGVDVELDLASADVGGIVVACSDMFFGSRHNLLFSSPSTGMHDGWETRRSRRVGHDWAVVRLGVQGVANRIVVDTAHFKGNCPSGFALDATAHYDGDATVWLEIFARVPLQPNTRHVFFANVAALDATHVRARIDPDGGLARLRVFGRVSDNGKSAHRVKRLNAMLPKEADHALLSCCGSRAWSAQMAGARPFADDAALLAQATLSFSRLTPNDWLEAFAAHPHIGGAAAATATATSLTSSAHEQHAVNNASADTLTQLAALNADYARKHGFIYIIKATGKSADEMLAVLRARIDNDSATELRNAAREQQLITLLRLQRLC